VNNPKSWIALAALLIQATAGAQNSSKNPFEMGVGQKILSPRAAEDLGVTQEVQDENLKAALRDAANQGSQAALRTYVDAARKYVLETGFKRKRLVSVLAINQGLALAYGVRDEIREDIMIQPPIIKQEINPDLRNTILRDSIQMAVDFAARSDRTGEVLHLEYEDLATLRLVRGQGWALKAFTPETTYGVLRAVLYQWVNLLAFTDFQYPERWGTLLVAAQSLINSCPEIPESYAGVRSCSEKMNAYIGKILADSKMPVQMVIAESYEMQRDKYFRSLDAWEALNVMKSAGEELKESLRMSTTRIYEQDQRLWRSSKRLADRSVPLDRAHFAVLKEYLFRNDAMKLSLHAAYVLAIRGSEEERKWIVQKAQKMDNALQVRDLMRIASDPMEAQHLLNLASP
jgi:hypothetical protein